MSNVCRTCIAVVVAAGLGVADAKPRVAVAPRSTTARPTTSTAVRAIAAPPLAAIAVGGFVYWTQPTAELASRTELWRATLAGEERARLGANAGYALATDGGTVYYTDVEALAIRAFDTRSGSFTLLARTRSTPIALAAGGGFVYWTEDDDAGIRRIRATSGAVVRLPVGDRESSLAADATDLYVLARGTIARVPHGASEHTVVARGLRGADEIALNARSIYVTAMDALYRVSKSGSTAICVGRAGLVNHLATIGATVYWTSADDPRVPDGACRGFEVGTIRSMKDDGRPKVIATGCDVRGVVSGERRSFVIELARLAPLDSIEE